MPTTIVLEKCAGCIFGAVKYVKQSSAPESVTVAVVGDTTVDYLLDADDNASLGANESILVDGSTVLPPRVVISGSRHAKVNVRLTPRSSVTFRLLGASQSSITVFVSAAKQAVSSDGGIVRGGGTGATVVVPSGTVLSGGVIIQLSDTSGVRSDYPALSDRAYNFSAVPEPGSRFDTTKALQLNLPLDRLPSAGEHAVASVRLNGIQYWASGTVRASASKSIAIRSGEMGNRLRPTSSAGVLSISIYADGSTNLAGLTVPVLVRAPRACTAGEYPPSEWVLPPLLSPRAHARKMEWDPFSQLPAVGAIAIVLVPGWDFDEADCETYVATGQSGDSYFKRLLAAVESQSELGKMHPVFAFTYPTHRKVAESGLDLAAEIKSLISTEGLAGVAIVAHSMGGLVSREAAVTLEAEPSTRGRLRGIITLATPHNGAPVAARTYNVFADIAKVPTHGFFGLPTPGSEDLVLGLSARQYEEVPIYASAGDINPLVGPHWDGIVPVTSAIPEFITLGRRHTATLPRNHPEMADGRTGVPLVDEPVFQRVFGDLKTLVGTQTQWTEFAAGFPVQSGPIVGVIGSKLFVSGGGQGASCCSSFGWSYDSSNGQVGTTRQLAIGGSGICCAATAVFGNRLYVFSALGQFSYAYDATLDLWFGMPSMPANFVGQMAGTIGGRIYVLGYAGPPSYTPDLFYYYDPVAEQWVERRPPTQRHLEGSGGVLDGKFVVAGGVDGSNRMNSSVEIYDPTTDTWRFGSSMPFPTRSSATASKGSRLYVVGGLDNPGSTNLQGLDRVMRYDLATDKWSLLTRLPDTRQGARAAILGNSLFVLGGTLIDNHARPSVLLDLAAFP